MGFAKVYFQREEGAPAPLSVAVSRRVRFEEVDMLRIVWHGHYVSFLDDGRVAFGDKYGFTYKDFKENGFAAPIVQMHIDYQAPLYFDEVFTIEATAHWCEALRLNFEYRLTGEDNRLCARAYTVQLLTDFQGRILLIPPEFIATFRNKWKKGQFS